MILINQIINKKDLVAAELFEWAETFDLEVDEEGENSTKSYDIVFDLASRLKDRKCNKANYADIIFHIYQINYNETRIHL